MIERTNMEIAEFASNSVYSQQSKALAKKNKGRKGRVPQGQRYGEDEDEDGEGSRLNTGRDPS